MFQRWRGSKRTRGPVDRHDVADRPWAAPDFGNESVHAAIDAHYGRFIHGEPTVWHEVLSDLVHIDVFMWRPTEQRPMFTFATQGMSNLPMSVPRAARQAGAADRAELLVCLPPDWPVPDEGEAAPWSDVESYLPVRSMKALARLPHEYDTWLGDGHTVPNGDPPEPFHDGTHLSGWALVAPMTLPREFQRLMLADGSPIDFFGIVALNTDEMAFKLERGMDELIPHLRHHGVSELLRIDRPSSLTT